MLISCLSSSSLQCLYMCYPSLHTPLSLSPSPQDPWQPLWPVTHRFLVNPVSGGSPLSPHSLAIPHTTTHSNIWTLPPSPAQLTACLSPSSAMAASQHYRHLALGGQCQWLTGPASHSSLSQEPQTESSYRSLLLAHYNKIWPEVRYGGGRSGGSPSSSYNPQLPSTCDHT